jgi:hypothetical protein
VPSASSQSAARRRWRPVGQPGEIDRFGHDLRQSRRGRDPRQGLHPFWAGCVLEVARCTAERPGEKAFVARASPRIVPFSAPYWPYWPLWPCGWRVRARGDLEAAGARRIANFLVSMHATVRIDTTTSNRSTSPSLRFAG